MGRIITTDDLMAHLDIGGDNPARVPHKVLEDIIASAEGYAERYARRVFAPLDPADSPVTKTFSVRGNGRVRLPDLRSATAVTLNGNAVSEGYDYLFPTVVGDEPITSLRLISWSPYTGYLAGTPSTLSVTGLWGFNPTPPEVFHAVLLIAARAYRKRDAGYSDQVDTGTGAFDYRAAYPAEAIDTLNQFRIPNVAIV